MSLCGLTPGKEIPPLKLLLMAEIMQQIIIGCFSHDLRWLLHLPGWFFLPKRNAINCDCPEILTLQDPSGSLRSTVWVGQHATFGGVMFQKETGSITVNKQLTFFLACKLGTKTYPKPHGFFQPRFQDYIHL